MRLLFFHVLSFYNLDFYCFFPKIPYMSLEILQRRPFLGHTQGNQGIFCNKFNFCKNKQKKTIANVFLLKNKTC